MNETKRVTERLDWNPDVPGDANKTALGKLVLFANGSRDGDYFLAAVTNRTISAGGFNVFLIQEQYKLQFMFELVDALNDALTAETADPETTLYVSTAKYLGQEQSVVTRVSVEWTPSGSVTFGQGLLTNLDAWLFMNGGRCEVRVEAKVVLKAGGEEIKFRTDDWRQGAILARGYFKARVYKKGFQEFRQDAPFVQRVQLA